MEWVFINLTQKIVGVLLVRIFVIIQEKIFVLKPNSRVLLFVQIVPPLILPRLLFAIKIHSLKIFSFNCIFEM